MPFYTMPDGEKLFVREIGHGEPVLVLSGLGMQSWQWLPFIFQNIKHYKFIIPDWRGFGGSKNCKIPQELDAIQNHWRDVDSLITQLQLDQFMLIAYSMGATTAMHGMQYGNLREKLKAYLNIDQTPKIPTDESWQFGLFGKKHYKFKRLLQDLSKFLHQYVEYRFVDDLPLEPRNQLVQIWLSFIKIQGSNKFSPFIFNLALKHPQLQKHILPIRRLDYLTWYIDNYLNHDEDYRDAISELDCATTFFIGEQSTLYPSEGQKQISSRLKNANTIIFKRSGHTPLITEPVKFSKEIQQFLKQAI
ncbi:alpha/beta fold hydrolase [Acinetobacter sp. ANC 3832]|uniref:alpha/beta fold hydrolase n=1 Tax=Acinetobacter sp. ANC 3832 TaxID=1977874 RepID=UPI000A345655|nr:alpha/beta hydrolase [Acinetobacter sp. ANC 3832]OTG89791.1 alpha/beta hydrolase [Acinetobacter sp. ANC 3832]